MLSLQGIICKQLKNQNQLPEKWKDLALEPIKQPITTEEGFIPIMTSNSHELGSLIVENAVEDSANAWHAFNPYCYEGYKIKVTHSNRMHTEVIYTPKTPIPEGTQYRFRVYCTPEMLSHKTMWNNGTTYYPNTSCTMYKGTKGSGGGESPSIKHNSMTKAGQFYYSSIQTTSSIVKSIGFSTNNSYGTAIWYNYLIMPNIILV